MPSWTDLLVKLVIDPLLMKEGVSSAVLSGLDLGTGSQKPTRHTKKIEEPMGSLLRFILINAATVIGAKLMDEAGQYLANKMKQRAAVAADEPKVPDAPTLETRTCPKCGAFRVRGEACNCH